MSSAATHDRFSGLELERYLLGELPPARADALERALLKDESLRQRLGALEASSLEILAAYPPRVVAAMVVARSSLRDRALGRRRLVYGSLFLCSTMAALIAFLSWYPRTLTDEVVGEPTYLALKGADAIWASRRTPQGYAPLSMGDHIAAGDTVQLEYQVVGDPVFVAIVSVDGRGVVTRHFPDSGVAVARVPGRHRLDHAYELDDAPAFERFFLLARGEPFRLDDVEHALHRWFERAGDDPWSEVRELHEYGMRSLVLLKENEW